MTVADSVLFEFENSFTNELPALSTEWQPEAVPQPEVVALNRSLALEIGTDPAALDSLEGTELLGGNRDPIQNPPVAMAYAGHQFGGYSPRLGDGRALLLGEVTDTAGTRRDIHLKGSGRTPFARGGDGKAALGPMLREYLIAEAMHALGISTTRALAVVTTGENITRDGPVPGAVLTRVAASHIRVGTFEYAARLEDTTVLPALADYAIHRHYPKAADSEDPYLGLLESVIESQAALLAQWMLVGFIHGVMNTDNMTISGEGIDYGPCAFMDRYDPDTVFSSIDHGGRYAYSNQPAAAQWNLTRFAETLLPLVDGDHDAAVSAATEKLEMFTLRFQQHWLAGMRAKLGLVSEDPSDNTLFESYLSLLGEERVDFTMSFRALADQLRGSDESLRSMFSDGGALEGWLQGWQDRLAADGRDPEIVAAEMDNANPLYIPRNHLVESALEASHNGDLEPFRELLDVVIDPFEEREGLEEFALPAPDGFDTSYQTFCGT